MLHKSLPGTPDYQQLYNEAVQTAQRYQDMYTQAMKWLNETTKKQFELENYLYELKLNRFKEAFETKPKYFEQTTTTKFC